MGTCVVVKRPRRPDPKPDFTNLLLIHLRNQTMKEMKSR